MRKLVVSTFLTLDGVMQAPGGPDEDPTGGFRMGGWSVNYWDGQMGEWMDQAWADGFDLVLGRGTYDIFAAHWPFAGEEPGAAELNAAHKYVASRTLTNPTWANTTVLGEDVVAEIAVLKTQDGPELQIHGSWGLIQSLLPTDLIDEFRLMVFPLVVGPGKRLFGDGTPPIGLALQGSETSSTGVVMGTWVRSGPVQPGSFALENPTEQELERRRQL